MLYFAHTRDSRDTSLWEPLEDHLQKTAALAEEFTSSFAPAGWGTLLGLWHDLGKYQAAFQSYLLSSVDHNCTDTTKTPHAPVGALKALQEHLQEAAWAIQAHHGSLCSASELLDRVERGAKGLEEIQTVLAANSILTLARPERPPWLNRKSLSPWVRFLFSSLIDADSLATEAWHRGKPRQVCDRTLFELRADLLTRLSQFENKSEIDALRQYVQQHCREAAGRPTGHFQLAVPTGGGKTLASLLFGLEHAISHHLRRVIVVLPFTSIIDQTAAVFRGILGDAVLEHHSNLDPEKESLLNREASENWDSPVIVTTAVQFFESLFASRKRDCRKLHRIARSVIVLDEVQTLPLHFQLPIQYALDALTQFYGSTVVHCSATQTDLIAPRSTAIVDPIEIRELFPGISSRVRLEWDIDEEIDIEALAADLQSNSFNQALVIVETRRDAYQLALLLGHPWLHLSAAMCAEHRRKVINDIKERLPKGQTCLVVSTQLVEAGVDLDFPIVYRALAGFDTLAQAAGRCNREGKLSEGVLRVFRPANEPPGISLKQRRRCADSMLKQGGVDLFDPNLYPEFFRRLSNFFKPDERGVMALELSSDFPKVAELFKMIDDEFSVPVIAPYSDSRGRVERLRAHAANRDALRALQPYVVNLRPRDIQKLRSSGALEPLFPFQDDDETRIWSVLPAQKSCYDAQFGFVASSSVLLV